jgi:hypothetical protein
MLIREEAKATRQVLLHLMEIERREIHLARGYGSLHSFAVEVLGYSDGSAARRVAAMRLIREMPETAEQLVAGSLTLETMSTLSNHFRRIKPTKEARTRLAASAQHLSKRELEKKLGKPEMTPVYLKPDLVKKLEELKIVFGMTSLERILNQLADQALARARVPARVKEMQRLERLEREKLSSGRADSGKNPRETEAQLTPPAEQQLARQFTPPAEQQLARQFTPPAEQQRARQFTPPPEQPTPTAPSKLTVPVTGTATAIKRDAPTFIHSRSAETTEANLRVLCSNHNRFRAPTPPSSLREGGAWASFAVSLPHWRRWSPVCEFVPKSRTQHGSFRFFTCYLKYSPQARGNVCRGSQNCF